MSKEETIEIPYSYYVRLELDSARLEQLEWNGVDNWSYYGCMCYENGEDECIFCTEDEEKFLNLQKPEKV